MKDGRTHLAHKAEHAVDLETGAIVAVTLQGADEGDTTTIVETATAAAEQIEDAQADVDGAAVAGRDHRRQGVSQQSDDGRPRRRRASAPTSRSRTAVDATGRRSRRPRRRCIAIVAGFADDAAGA